MPLLALACEQGSSLVPNKQADTDDPNAAPTWPSEATTYVAHYGSVFQHTLPTAIDSQRLTYSVQDLQEQWAFDPASRVLVGIYQGDDTEQVLTYLASDGHSTVTQSVTISFAHAPQLEWEAGRQTSAQGVSGIEFQLVLPEASDTSPSSNSNPEYVITNLPNGWTFDPSTRLLVGTATSEGETVLGYETSVGETTESLSFTIDFDANDTPEWSIATPSYEALSNETFTFTLAEATDSQALTYAVAGIPTEWSFDPSSRALIGSASSAQSISFTYYATDGGITISTTPTINIATNHAPQWETELVVQEFLVGIDVAKGGSIALPTAADVQSITYRLQNTDSTNDLALPTGWSHDESARTLSIEAASAVAGTTELFYLADDGTLTRGISLTITVGTAPMWDDPVLTFSIVHNVDRDLSLPTPLSADNANTTFDRSLGTVPEGLVFDTNTGLLSGQYTGDATQLVLDYTVSNLIGGLTTMVTIDVAPTPVWAQAGEIFYAEAGDYFSLDYVLDSPVVSARDFVSSPLALYDIAQNQLAGEIGTYDSTQAAYRGSMRFENNGYYVVLPRTVAEGDSLPNGALTVKEGDQPMVDTTLLDLSQRGNVIGTLAAGTSIVELEVYFEEEKWYRLTIDGGVIASEDVTVPMITFDPESESPFFGSAPPFWRRFHDSYDYSSLFVITERFEDNSVSGTSLKNRVPLHFLELLPENSDGVSYTLSDDAPEFLHFDQAQVGDFIPEQTGVYTLSLSFQPDSTDRDYVFSLAEWATVIDYDSRPFPEEPGPEFTKAIEYLYYDAQSAGTTYEIDHFDIFQFYFGVVPDRSGSHFLPDGTHTESSLWTDRLPILQFRMELFPEQDSDLNDIVIGLIGTKEGAHEKDPFDEDDFSDSSATIDIADLTFSDTGASIDLYLDVQELQATFDETIKPSGDFVANSLYIAPFMPSAYTLLGFVAEDEIDANAIDVMTYFDF